MNCSLNSSKTCPKSSQSKFWLKNTIFQNSPKYYQIFGPFLFQNLLPKPVKRSPIWSHWQCDSLFNFFINLEWFAKYKTIWLTFEPGRRYASNLLFSHVICLTPSRPRGCFHWGHQCSWTLISAYSTYLTRFINVQCFDYKRPVGILKLIIDRYLLWSLQHTVFWP